jgi:hypothetical protein
MTIPDGMVVYLEGMPSRIMLGLLLGVFSKMEPLFHFKMGTCFFFAVIPCRLDRYHINKKEKIHKGFIHILCTLNLLAINIS